MKKILAIVPALALAFAFSTSLALASDRVEVKNESEAKILNDITSSSNTGYNKIYPTNTSSRHHHSSTPVAPAKIVTGDAFAWAYSDAYANDTKIVVKAPKSGRVEVDNDSEAWVTNNVASSANTGYNYISSRGNSTIKTGSANSRSDVFTMVNSNIIKVK